MAGAGTGGPVGMVCMYVWYVWGLGYRMYGISLTLTQQESYILTTIKYLDQVEETLNKERKRENERD